MRGVQAAVPCGVVVDPVRLVAGSGGGEAERGDDQRSHRLHVGHAGDRLDGQPQQPVAEIAVGELLTWPCLRRHPHRGEQLFAVREVAMPLPEVTVESIAEGAAGVLEQFPNRSLTDRIATELGHEVGDAVFQADPARFDELQDGSGGERLGVRGDPKQVVGPHRDPLFRVGEPVRAGEFHPAASPDRDLSTRQSTVPDPIGDPAIDRLQGRGQIQRFGSSAHVVILTAVGLTCWGRDQRAGACRARVRSVAPLDGRSAAGRGESLLHRVGRSLFIFDAGVTAGLRAAVKDDVDRIGHRARSAARSTRVGRGRDHLFAPAVPTVRYLHPDVRV